LNTPIIGRWANTVATSWTDMLAGLSRLYAWQDPAVFLSERRVCCGHSRH